MPLIFTEPSVLCQDCAAGYNSAVTHTAEWRVYKAKVGL